MLALEDRVALGLFGGRLGEARVVFDDRLAAVGERIEAARRHAALSGLLVFLDRLVVLALLEQHPTAVVRGLRRIRILLHDLVDRARRRGDVPRFELFLDLRGQIAQVRLGSQKQAEERDHLTSSS